MMDYDTQDLTEIPWDMYCLKGIDEAMGVATVAGDFSDLSYDEETGEEVEWTEEQQDAIDAYDDMYYRFMEVGKELIEAFGFRATYG